MLGNRSCQEFIPKPIIPSNYEDPTTPHVNCANCKRWKLELGKCREMIWIIPWIEYKTSICEEELTLNSGWCQY